MTDLGIDQVDPPLLPHCHICARLGTRVKRFSVPSGEIVMGQYAIDPNLANFFTTGTYNLKTLQHTNKQRLCMKGRGQPTSTSAMDLSESWNVRTPRPRADPNTNPLYSFPDFVASSTAVA